MKKLTDAHQNRYKFFWLIPNNFKTDAKVPTSTQGLNSTTEDIITLDQVGTLKYKSQNGMSKCCFPSDKRVGKYNSR